MAVFDFCPNSQVPVTMPRDPTKGVSLNSWHFSAKPTTPFQRKFRVTLHGLHWFLNSDGTYDENTDGAHNARVLELFYQAHETWDSFTWQHPHFATPLTVRFDERLEIPQGISNSNGLIEAFDMILVEHNPGYA